jgi:hypothetical protein
LPAPDCDLYTLWLNAGERNYRFASDAELLAAAKRLSHDQRLVIVTGTPASSDPDLIMQDPRFEQSPLWHLHRIEQILISYHMPTERSSALDRAVREIDQRRDSPADWKSYKARKLRAAIRGALPYLGQ